MNLRDSEKALAPPKTSSRGGLQTSDGVGVEIIRDHPRSTCGDSKLHQGGPAVVVIWAGLGWVSICPFGLLAGFS